MLLSTFTKKIRSVLGKGPDPYCRISHEEINSLPLKGYEGEITVVRDRQDLASAMTSLRREELLGFDTETRPSFWKGTKFPPALIQLAGEERVFIFQLKHMGLPEELRALLADPAIIKAGVALNYDLTELQQLAHFQPAAFVDLGDLAREKGLKNHGLRGLAAVLLGFRIAKGSTRKSNWENDVLSPVQVRYAATDAWVGRELYLELRDL